MERWHKARISKDRRSEPEQSHKKEEKNGLWLWNGQDLMVPEVEVMWTSKGILK